MSPHPDSLHPSRGEPTPATGADAPMSVEQMKLLRQVAFDAFEPDAFSRSLTQTEAARRIAMLQAKLRLQDEPPHVL